MTRVQPVSGNGLDAGGMRSPVARDAAADAASFAFPSLGVDAGPLGGGGRKNPTRAPSGWMCRPDFALDAICDCGCAAIDGACEPAGCADASCTVPACNACFDANGARVPCGEPGAWLCAQERKHDGICDCGCGDHDPDCAGKGCYPWGCDVDGCQRCVDASGTWGACKKPAAWTCAKSALGDGRCDCGCGNLDPDCKARSCSEPGCRADGCDVCRDAKGAIRACHAAASWTCSAAAERDGICDCGCGTADPDCKGAGCSGAGCDVSACARCHDEFGRNVPCPTHYACDPATFADGSTCDCGCGEADPDCAGKGCNSVSCKASACEVRHGAHGKPLPPATWTCAAASYGASDGCDCGCGALDPDCHAGGGGCAEPGCQDDHCDSCRDATGTHTSCRSTCDPAHFGTGDGCDCGCGEQDPDCGGQGCSDPLCWSAACTRCWDASASAVDCKRSACAAALFGDGVCDCGCRESDPDCAGLASCVTPGCSTPSCGRCHAADGGATACTDWYCTLEKQSGDSCNCGCGAIDADCAGGGCAAPGCSAPACVTCRAATMAPMSCAP